MSLWWYLLRREHAFRWRITKCPSRVYCCHRAPSQGDTPQGLWSVSALWRSVVFPAASRLLHSLSLFVGLSVLRCRTKCRLWYSLCALISRQLVMHYHIHRFPYATNSHIARPTRVQTQTTDCARRLWNCLCWGCVRDVWELGGAVNMHNRLLTVPNQEINENSLMIDSPKYPTDSRGPKV